MPIGVVVAAYPEGNSVDVLLLDGSRLSNVQVLSPSASSNTGMVDLPDVGGPPPSDDARWNPQAQRDRYVKAIVVMHDGVPVVHGFLLPQVNQITFKRKNLRVMRHASDVYSTIDDAGNLELAFPGGTFLRVATSPAHEDLSGLDFDKKWKIARNTGQAVHVQLTVMNGGAQKASFHVDPDGNVDVTHAGNLTTHTVGTATLHVEGNATLTMDNDLTATVGGNLSVTASGNATVHADGDATVSADGDATVSGTNLNVTATTKIKFTAPALEINVDTMTSNISTNWDVFAPAAANGAGMGTAGVHFQNTVSQNATHNLQQF